MNRRFWIKAHLFAAAFFAPTLTIIAISGGLYLLGVKGSVNETAMPLPVGAALDLNSQTLEQDVRALLNNAGVKHNFEYLRADGNTLTTRPTSNTYYVFKVSADGVSLKLNVPSLQKRMIELHKGHGPQLFKEFQKVMAAALLFVLLSGAWLGLASTGLRRSTIASVGGGLLVFLGLVFLA